MFADLTQIIIIMILDVQSRIRDCTSTISHYDLITNFFNQNVLHSY
jgi:hypothetical protein